jgi:rhodanese-related sulfurtransferase
MAKRKRKPNKQAQNAKKKNQLIIVVLAVVAILAILIVLNTSNSATVNSLPDEINTGLGYQKFQEGAFLLDVRTPEEWVDYHVDGATLIPLDELESRVNEVPFDKEVIVICNSGNRSVVGRDILRAAGHTKVTSIAGGIQGWMAAGYPTVSGE